MIQGVLFDMDGVLVDSEEFICQAAIRMFEEKGFIVHPSDFLPFVGTGENRYLGGVAEKYRIPFETEIDKARTYEIYAQLVKGKLHPLPGVKEFITRCKDKNLKLAVATSADRIKMDINLREIGLSQTTFDCLVNGLDVEKKKPWPDIYLKAAEILSLSPSNCLVVEDAVSGIKAGKSAGCKVLGLTTSFPEDKLGEADWICENLSNAPEASIHW